MNNSGIILNHGNLKIISCVITNVLTLYVPLVLVVKNGKVIDGHEGTIESHDATERKMTNDEKEQLTKIYTKLMSEAK